MSSITDKITGKAKQVVGDLKDDKSLHREGRHEEEKGEQKEQLERAEERVETRRRTSPTSSARPDLLSEQT